MKNIFVIGAGKSSSYLIQLLAQQAQQFNWQITVGDVDLQMAEQKIKGFEHAQAIAFDINDDLARVREISKSDLVISMLPAHMHLKVAKDCVALSKHMVTASYVSDELNALNEEAKKAGVVLMNEIGVDPGIDHLSAMKMIDSIRAEGGQLKIFESFTGGLLAPEFEKDNPWKYKFSWNPRNVVLAGQGGAVKFRQENSYKYIPYHNVFRRTEIIDIDGYGKFEGYANRDSLKYISVYGLNDIPTIYRGTLRRPGFCKAWDIFVKLGATDDSYYMENVEKMTYREFINSFLAYNPYDSVELKLMHYLGLPQDDITMEKLEWLGIFSNKEIGLNRGTPAQILQKILEEKWTLLPEEKDMIVMYHKMGYALDNELHMIESSMVCKGDDHVHTAMAKTVGLPVAIATRFILNGTISSPGVVLPIKPEIYEPMLAELAEHGIVFTEKEVAYKGY